MSWFNFCTENLQKRCCRYLLQRYVGRFLEHKIEPNQLSINVLDGAVSIGDIVLDVQALNDVGDEHQLPFEFVEGSVDKISLSVPWRNMLKESSIIHVEGLSLTVRPNVKETEGIPSSMLESVWSSMSNSVYSSPDSDYEESFDNAPESEQVSGLEVFTQAIESILNRIKVKFSNTVIKLEYMPDFMKLGLGLQLHIISLDYIDEVADESKEGIIYDSLAFLTKKLVIEGVFLQTYEFKCPKFNNGGPISKTNISEPITIAELTGTQAIRMVLKHNPSLPGPKLNLEINFGPLNVICSPRQLYLIIEILRGISKPLIEQKQSAPIQKPMSESDFNRIELDLFNHVESRPDVGVGLRGMQGWSNLQEDEEEFFPLQGVKNKPFVPSMNSSMTSSMSSIASSKSDLSSRHTRHKNKGKNEWLGETNHFNVQLASLCVVLIHEDILAVNPETDIITQCSLNEMRKISHQFLMAVQNADIIQDSDKITKSLERNHLKLIATNVTMEGDEKTNETVKDVNITAAGGGVLIMEVLVETKEEITQYIPILKFVQDEKCSLPKTSNTFNRRDIQVQFKHNTKSTRYCNPVSSEIKIIMQEAFSEVDISIINRLSSYIYRPDFNISEKNPLNICQPQFNEVIESVNDTNINCTLNINYLVIKFRFPVPDLRPLSDINRLAWWKRILRDDILWLYLSDAEGSFTKTSQQIINTGYEVQCRSIEALFQEGNSNTIIPIAKCKGIDDDLKTIRMDSKGRPKLVLKLCPVSNQSEVKASNFNIEHNMTSSVYVESSKKPSPFASKKIMRQRNHHSDCYEHEQKLGDGEVQVVPGSREEIMEFVENTNANAKVYLDINVPCLFVTLPSKHLYETIYNRFTNDLFFWSPSFPIPASHGGDSSRLSHLSDRTQYFAPCKSGIQFDSESESEDETSNIYYSCGQSSMNIVDPMIKRTEFCLNLNVAQGLFTIVTQSRDRSGRVIPQHYGELQIAFEDLYLYMAAGYESAPRHNFICIQANQFSLSHENLTTNRSNILTQEVICRKNKSLKRILYKIPDGMDFKERTSVNKSDMLTVIVELSVCNHIKTIRVANEIYGTTLRHIFSDIPQSWYYQLSDFFDVVDYPVAGYESPHVITELHQHFSECLIDYRPFHLPYQCVLTIGSFSLSSNIVARSKASTLQIVSEDVAFFISAHLSKAENLDLISNYICVMDLGVFELSLKLSKGSKLSNVLSQPEMDLRMAVNVIHIRTCADSAYALCRLISYLASDGDKSSIEEETTDFEGVDQEEPVLLDQGDSDNNSLSSLILEAMHDETIGEKKSIGSIDSKQKPDLNNSSSGNCCKGVEVFYFPDETNKIITPLDTLQPLSIDLEEDYDIENEFYFVEHEAGSGLMPRSNIPEVRMLTDTQIRVVNNYFKAPVGKIDMLQAPKGHPIPVVRYTLREMTLIWHIYGGTDFGAKTINSHNELTKHVTIVSETNSCPTSPNTLRPSLSRYYSQTNINFQKNPILNKGSAKISQARTRFCCSVLPTSWQAKGGAGRQHHVLMQLQLNKVRFQQEVYPLHTKQAMRQVILIQDFEIRDKLASSNINKFLYLYSSEAMPKQHDANMLVAKAAHTRPDSNLKAQECCIKVSMLPLRLNIDQDSLIFLISFFNQFNALNQKTKDEILNANQLSSKPQEPIMTLGNAGSDQQDILPNPLIELNDEFDEHFGQKDEIPVTPKLDAGKIQSDNKSPVYIRQFVFSPDVTIRLDYEGRHIDLSQGSLAGLLMGLAQLNCSEITLKRIVHKHGLLGFDKLLTYITQEWLQDIKKHQLPSLLGGVGPMYSFVRLIQGFRDLVQLPIEQYQKDGRIVRGLQRGANSFTTSTAMAALEIATRIVNLIQRVAETTYDMVNPGPSMRQLRLQESKKKNRSNKRSHPADIREGVATAVMLVKEGIGETAQTIVRIASEEHEIKGTAGMVGGVMRQIPPTALTPIILASQATCNVLQGVRCQLAPDARVEALQKWRCD